jgi:hypothetical protein
MNFAVFGMRSEPGMLGSTANYNTTISQYGTWEIRLQLYTHTPSAPGGYEFDVP